MKFIVLKMFYFTKPNIDKRISVIHNTLKTPKNKTSTVCHECLMFVMKSNVFVYHNLLMKLFIVPVKKCRHILQISNDRPIHRLN